MQDGKRKGPPPNKKPMSMAAIKAELANQKTRIDEIRTAVNQLKDILQVQDNWHSRVSKMIGERVVIVLDVAIGVGCFTLTGELLWTDRYNVGIDDDDGGEKPLIINKGHLVTMRLE